MSPSTTPLPVPTVPIAPSHKTLFSEINTYVHAYMSSAHHDNSHDYAHILRVLSNAHAIYKAELQSNPSQTSSLDTSALFLAALLHDVGDYKYASSHGAGEGEDEYADPRDADIDHDPKEHVRSLLVSRGCSEDLAQKIQDMVTHVSYSHEIRNPTSVKNTLAQHPELAIVQDADRLDAIGAVGIGRCFAFGGAKSLGGEKRELKGAIEHFEEKLVKLGGMMKTGTGREMAGSRTERLRRFMEWWREEDGLGFGFE